MGGTPIFSLALHRHSVSRLQTQVKKKRDLILIFTLWHLTNQDEIDNLNQGTSNKGPHNNSRDSKQARQDYNLEEFRTIKDCNLKLYEDNRKLMKDF